MIDIIAESTWAEPRTLLLSYELDAFPSRHQPVTAMMRKWIDSGRPR